MPTVHLWVKLIVIRRAFVTLSLSDYITTFLKRLLTLNKEEERERERQFCKYIWHSGSLN